MRTQRKRKHEQKQEEEEDEEVEEEAEEEEKWEEGLFSLVSLRPSFSWQESSEILPKSTAKGRVILGRLLRQKARFSQCSMKSSIPQPLLGSQSPTHIEITHCAQRAY